MKPHFLCVFNQLKLLPNRIPFLSSLQSCRLLCDQGGHSLKTLLGFLGTLLNTEAGLLQALLL